MSVAKRALRASLRTKLKSLPTSDVEAQSELVASHVVAHPAFRRAQTISCYLSMPLGELDTSSLVRSILESGKTLFVPRIDNERGEMVMLRIYDEDDLRTLPSRTWGIKEPGLDHTNGQRRTNAMDPESSVIDLVLLPGLAFDHTMSRLGHGKGYYDRFLTSYQSRLTQAFSQNDQSSRMPILCLALTDQLLDPYHDPIPVLDHDWKVDGVIYPGGLVKRAETDSNNYLSVLV